jgi:hypothetical protein
MARARGWATQGMGWSVLPLFGQDGQLAVPETATFQPVYRYRPEASDAQFFASWGDQSKAGSKRLKTLPGNCVVEITEVAEGAKPPGRLTPSLIPLKPACPADDKQTVLVRVPPNRSIYLSPCGPSGDSHQRMRCWLDICV